MVKGKRYCDFVCGLIVGVFFQQNGTTNDKNSEKSLTSSTFSFLLLDYSFRGIGYWKAGKQLP